jgi:hypothetical protein
MAWLWASGAAAQQDRDDENRGLVMAVTTLASPAAVGTAYRQVPLSVAATSVRLLLEVSDSADGEWTVVIADVSGREVETVRPSDFQSGRYWTAEIDGGAARVRLAQQGAAAAVAVVAFASAYEPMQQQGWIGRDDSLDISDTGAPERAKRVAARVARLRYMSSSVGASCTGFLMGKDLLMTNQHCIRTPEELSSVRIQFVDAALGVGPSEFKALRMEASNPSLDYTVLRLSGDASHLGRFHVGAGVARNNQLLVIQHPDGGAKRVAFPPRCAVGIERVNGKAPNADFGHTCDTLGGSSGAPVLDWSSLRVVGLHHWTFDKRAKGSLNQAVHIGLIVADLRAQALRATIAGEIVDELLRGE